MNNLPTSSGIIRGQGTTFRSKLAYPQLYYMLEHGEFKQRSMARDLDVPHGAQISGFVNWMVDLGFVIKVKNKRHRIYVYEVSAPVALIKFYSRFRNMANFKLSKDMGTDRDKVIEYFRDRGDVFCLTTALEHYTEYVRDPAVNVYVDGAFLNEMQSKETEGTVRVNMYPFAPYRKDNAVQKDGLEITTKLRTLIDLFCTDMAYAGEPLVMQLWPWK